MSAVQTTQTIAARTGLLPLEVDAFVGRRIELDEVRRNLGEHSLVTLVGPGGVGKTRMALRVASLTSRTFRDGARFTDLGTVADPSLLLPTIAEVVGLHDQARSVSTAALVDALLDQRLLLILDNCEHLVGEVAEVAGTLLRSCPGVRILATSRERLGIAGEAVLPVSPLPVPTAGSPDDPVSLPRYEAVSLFTERARAVLPEFALTETNSPDVARICREVDGIPLAIELAAARLRTLAPGDLAVRLSQRLSVLTTGNRSAPSRHQTMRLCVDWSYEACTAQERLLWDRLSIFAGSFGMDAVEDVCAFGPIKREAVLDLLGSLVEKSIVSRDGSSDDSRFRLLATIREYGGDRLASSGDLPSLQQRHLRWYAALVQRARAEQVGPRQQHWATRLDRELPNLRTALEHSLSDPALADVALDICGCLHLFWISRGLLSEGRRWLDRGLAASDSATAARAQALFSGVALSGFQGDLDVATAYAAACEVLAAELDDDVAAAYALSIAGMVALFSGDLEAAQVNLAEAADAHRATGDVLREVEILIGLALACGLSGETAKATVVHQRALEITRPRQESWYQSYSLWALGIALWRDGEHEQAASLLTESLHLRRRLNDALGSLWSLEGLALVAASVGQLERAAVLLAATSALSTRMGSPPATFPDLVVAYERCRADVEAALGDRAATAAAEQGVAMDVNAAIAYALDEGSPETVAPAADPWEVLTPREREVATLLAAGMSNRSIAESLVISPRTAENHVEHILTKLGLTSRAQVAAWAAGGSRLPTHRDE